MPFSFSRCKLWIPFIVCYSLFSCGAGHAGGVADYLRQRDLFPLPFNLDQEPNSGVCRNTGHSPFDQGLLSGWASECLLALNKLAGRGGRCNRKSGTPRASIDASDAVAAQFFRLPRPPDDLGSDEACLRDLGS